ncbi:MAG: NYN domain-containing protein [Actinomycetota bacterium]
MAQPKRVWVLIDGQNCYNDARRAFHLRSDPAERGQTSPLELAQLLLTQSRERRVLDSVRVYRGQPSNKRAKRSYARARRQRAAWEADGVVVRERPLKYPRDWPREREYEKGIDVALATDLVFHCAQRSFDRAIVVSTDTDLLPAIEISCDQQRNHDGPWIEVMSWYGTFPDPAEQLTRKRLSCKDKATGRDIWCHWIDEAKYQSVQDLTDYNAP